MSQMAETQITNKGEEVDFGKVGKTLQIISLGLQVAKLLWKDERGCDVSPTYTRSKPDAAGKQYDEVTGVNTVSCNSQYCPVFNGRVTPETILNRKGITMGDQHLVVDNHNR